MEKVQTYFSLFLALKIALGSLYKDDIILKPVQMIGVLAAGTLLQLVTEFNYCNNCKNRTLEKTANYRWGNLQFCVFKLYHK